MERSVINVYTEYLDRNISKTISHRKERNFFLQLIHIKINPIPNFTISQRSKRETITN